MATLKYINVKEVVKLTGRSTDEIRQLAQDGVLPAHKARKGHWRLNVDAVEKYFGIQINNPEEEIKESEEQSQFLSETRLITENFYQEVIERVCKAKSSIKIMTGHFKRFNLKPTKKQGKNYNDGTPFINFLKQKAEQGVSVEIVCSKPSPNIIEAWDLCSRKLKSGVFNMTYCIRNHAKVVIIDDKIAYIGSANLTPAGLGQPYDSPGNFEVGVITKDPKAMDYLVELFYKIVDADFCPGCHRANQCVEY
jgi:excisionase family DNA binding protein